MHTSQLMHVSSQYDCTTDCTKGFWHRVWQIPIHYIQFDINVARDVFHRKLDTIFVNLSQVACIADDFMVPGYKEDYSDHDEAVVKLSKQPERIMGS